MPPPRPDGLAYGLRRVCAAWWHGLSSSFYAMILRRIEHQLEAAGKASKVSVRSPRSVGPGAVWWRSKPTWRHRPAEGVLHRKAAGLGFKVFVATSGLPAKRVSPSPDARGSRPIAAAAVAAIPMTVRSSRMPRTSCGAVRWRSTCSRWTTAGSTGSSPPSSRNADVSAQFDVCNSRL